MWKEPQVATNHDGITITWRGCHVLEGNRGFFVVRVKQLVLVEDE